MAREYVADKYGTGEVIEKNYLSERHVTKIVSDDDDVSEEEEEEDEERDERDKDDEKDENSKEKEEKTTYVQRVLPSGKIIEFEQL